MWGESQIAMACTFQSAEAFGCVATQFQNSVTVRRRLFKCSLGTCQIHVYEIMHLNSITPMIFMFMKLGRVIVWLGWVLVPDLAGFQSHVI